MEAFLQGSFGHLVLGPGIVTIGRSTDNQLVVNTPIASSHHAEIRPVVSGYSLIDLGSTNGTFVNEQQLVPHLPRLLQVYDRIRIGDMVFSYMTDSSNVQRPFAPQKSHTDAPTAKVSAIDMKAFSQSEQFGNQPPAQNSSFLSRQQPFPSTYPPPYGQPNMPTWVTNKAYENVMPAPSMPSTPSSMQEAPVQHKSNTWLKVLLIGIAVVLVLGIAGGGVTAYLLTRPQPVMTIASTYQVGTTPAGSSGTVLHVSAHGFSGSSTITFLLDSLPVAGKQHVSSDANGTVKADLLITDDWPMGTHKLTGRDASGYMTKVGSLVVIVPQGQAQTPGPNGAPSDDKSFTLQVSVHPQDAGTGKQLDSLTETLTIQGKPDPAGGTVCQSWDDGQPHIYIGNVGNGITYRQTSVLTCSGTYKMGKLTYTETVTSEKDVYSDGTSCVAHIPYVTEHLEGAFTSQNTISGTFSSESVTVDCSRGSDSHQFNYNAQKGSWSGTL